MIPSQYNFGSQQAQEALFKLKDLPEKIDGDLKADKSVQVLGNAGEKRRLTIEADRNEIFLTMKNEQGEHRQAVYDLLTGNQIRVNQ